MFNDKYGLTEAERRKMAANTFVDEVKQAVDNLCRSKENAEDAISRIKRIAKLQAHQNRKSCQSPYAKFDKIRKRKH